MHDALMLKRQCSRDSMHVGTSGCKHSVSHALCKLLDACKHFASPFFITIGHLFVPLADTLARTLHGSALWRTLSVAY